MEILLDPNFGIFAFLAIALVIAITNAIALKRLSGYSQAQYEISPADLPMASVMVPARNEEHNIAACVTSLLKQNYPHYEILVLDDHSTDHTGEILTSLADQHGCLRILHGQPLPPGWVGKNWACHQLSQAARGELLLFVDADTQHREDTLSRAVSALVSEKIDLLTALPRQIVHTWGERLIVPVLYFSLMVFMPLPLAYRLRQPAFSAAIGQFLLFRRQAYDDIGGHAAVRAHGADDLALARLIKLHNLPWRMLDGTGCSSTRMYRGFRQAFDGFSKNLFAAFDYRILPFLFAWLWMGYIFFRPWVELAVAAWIFPRPAAVIWLSVAGILEAFTLWALIFWRLRFPLPLALAYLVIVFNGVCAALRSVVLSLGGRATWKGRTLVHPKIRWI